MKYVIGIDSDGTIFDTMNIKHKEVFWQCMFKKWNVNDENGEILKEAERVNLYSKKRGVNRFPGLYMALESCPELKNLDKKPLYDFVNSGYPLSNAGLKQYISDNKAEQILLDTLEWSYDSDRVFAEKTKNLLPFLKASKAIREISSKVDVVIISSASKSVLERDLSHADLTNCITEIMGQENGKKHQQLETVIKNLSPDRVLMIGDAVSDYDAAKKVGAYFYPIIPGKEESSWENFTNKYFESFINDTYNCEEENLYNEFLKVFEE